VYIFNIKIFVISKYFDNLYPAIVFGTVARAITYLVILKIWKSQEILKWSGKVRKNEKNQGIIRENWKKLRSYKR